MKSKRKWIFVEDEYPKNGQVVEVLRDGRPVRCVYIDHENFRSWKFRKGYTVKDYTKPMCWRPIDESGKVD